MQKVENREEKSIFLTTKKTNDIIQLCVLRVCHNCAHLQICTKYIVPSARRKHLFLEEGGTKCQPLISSLDRVEQVRLTSQ